MIERFEPTPENQLPLWFPTIYGAENIQAVQHSRSIFIKDAQLKHKQLLEYRNTRPFAKRIGMRMLGFPTDPVYRRFSLKGRVTVETAIALLVLPTVRHLPERDQSQKLNHLTVFDGTGYMQVETLPETAENWLLIRLLRESGIPLPSEDDLKKQDWASAIILFSNLRNVNGVPQGDRHQLLGAFNEHIGRGKKILSPLGKLIMAGLSIKPDTQ